MNTKRGIFSLFCLRKERNQAYKIAMPCARVFLLEVLNHLTYFHEMWYEHYATAGHSNFYFLIS
jgi:hypothetical protein